MKKAVICLLMLTLLTACSSPGKLSVISDPWWEQAYDANGFLLKSIKKYNLFHLSHISYKKIENKSELSDLLSNSKADTVLVTPAIYSVIAQNPAFEKKENYIILNGFYDDGADNVIAVYSSREKVYFRAGIKAAEFSALHSQCNVAAVFYEGSEVRKQERKSFVAGFESVDNRGKLVSYSQQTYSTGESLKNFIISAPKKNVGLFFFSGSSLNPFCLEQAVSLSIPVSGENLNSLGLYHELIEFSVDDDIMKIVKTALKTGLDGEIENDIPVEPIIRDKGFHF